MIEVRDIMSAAFNHLTQLELIYGDAVPSSELSKGFVCNGESISFKSGANGIFKAKQMDDVVLSIITTIPGEGSRNIYQDAEGDDGSYHYAFEESEKGEYRNQYLINTFEAETPFIYFKGIEIGR
ncbi:MAG: hypothetical protein QM500_13140, partial [Methylococcales bacterium]